MREGATPVRIAPTVPRWPTYHGKPTQGAETIKQSPYGNNDRMQNENLVNATSRHALRAAQRTNGDSGRLPEVFDEPQLKWWQRYFKWENLTVAGRDVKGWVVPQPLGVALIVVLLGVVGWAYKSNTTDQRETRDAVIRMETMLNERTRNFERQQDKFEQDMKDEHAVAAMQRENQATKQMKIVLALKEQGISVPE